MGLQYRNLDDRTRESMLEEAGRGDLYISPRFNDRGREVWPGLFTEALERYSDDWLAASLLRERAFAAQEPYTRAGVTRFRDVNAPQSAEMLAEGEFNRFYLRALCLRSIAEGDGFLTIYRAKAVREERPESAAKIGTKVAAEPLLDALRRADFVALKETMGVSNGPNSGLSAHL